MVGQPTSATTHLPNTAQFADAPDENLPVSMYRLARKAWVEYLCALGDAAAAEADAAASASESLEAEAEDSRAAVAAEVDGEESAEGTADRSEL